MLKIIKNTAVIIVTTAAIYFSVVFPQAIGIAVENAINRCLTVIIPSMFIFLCITTFISKSNIHSIIGIPFKFISEKLFRLPKEGFAVFLLSMISGYPAGIKLINDNFSQGNITASQAKVMNSFCFFSGPAFITGTAAAFLYPDSNAGLLIFISCLSGNIFTMFVFTRKLPKLKSTNSIKQSVIPNQLIPSVKFASSAMVQMCIMIVAFGGFISILEISGAVNTFSVYTSSISSMPKDTTKSIILSFLEISNIINLPSMQPQLLPIVSFLISFGGICVHMQISALADNNFSFIYFFAARLISASVSAITAYFFIPLLNIETPCGVTFKVVSQSNYSPLPSVLLLIMMIMLMEAFSKRKRN